MLLTCLKAAGEAAKENLIHPTGIAVDGNGNILVADTNNGRIEKFSPTGGFLSAIGSQGNRPRTIRSSRTGSPSTAVGNIYVAEVASNHRCGEIGVRRDMSSPSGKGPTPDFTDHAGSLLARMTRSMSSIRAARESLSSARMDRC